MSEAWLEGHGCGSCYDQEEQEGWILHYRHVA